MTAPAHDLRLLFKALSFAADHHRHDTRKGLDASPYINHPIDVAARLVDAGVEEPEVLAAAVLHDTVEDTTVTLEEIEAEFGRRTRDLVAALTDDKTLPKEERKRLQEVHASGLDPDAKRIKIADKTSNALDVGFTPPAGWSVERRREYLEWGERVVAGCRGVSAELEAEYDRVLARARARVEADAAASLPGPDRLPARPTESCYWVAPGFLAGNYPRTRFEDSSRDKVRRILDAGVTCFLDLTTRHDPLEPYESLVEQLAGAGAVRAHFPVTDMGIPGSREQTVAILDTIDRVRAEGGTVYLHCWGGVGRTGTIVGCWLVRHGRTGDEALARVSELWATRPDSDWSPSPQTDEQCRYVREWSEGE